MKPRLPNARFDAGLGRVPTGGSDAGHGRVPTGGFDARFAEGPRMASDGAGASVDDCRGGRSTPPSRRTLDGESFPNGIR